jgi:hypothetical protein
VNLLQNIATAQGMMPVIRVGGNTQYVNIFPSILANAVALLIILIEMKQYMMPP